MYNKFCGPVKPAAVEPMVSLMSELLSYIEMPAGRRRRKFLRILAHRMFWKRFGKKGQYQCQSSFCLGTGLRFKDKRPKFSWPSKCPPQAKNFDDFCIQNVLEAK